MHLHLLDCGPDGSIGNHSMNKCRFILTDPLRQVHRLTLRHRIPPWIMENNLIGGGQVEPDTTRLDPSLPRIE